MLTHMGALYAREVKRFQKILLDTIFSPLISTMLYLAIFGIVVGQREILGVPYVTFVYCGLLAMTLVNSSFSNPSFALIIAKNVGTMIDLQVTPLKPWQIGIAYAGAALTRGFLTISLLLLITGWFIPNLSIAHPLYLLIAFVLTGLEYGMLGVFFGMWAKNFEALTFMTSFVMQPMIFLAGTFYPLSSLPHPWSVISAFNPLHHNVNLIRYALTGAADGSPIVSLAVTLVLSIILFFAMQIMTQRKLHS